RGVHRNSSEGDPMSDMQERPQSLRRAPRPAPDERIDPVDTPSSVRIDAAPTVDQVKERATQAETPIRTADVTPEPPVRRLGRPRREATVPFSTRLTPEALQIIDEAAAREGLTIRAVIEQAVAHRWGGKA